jgi:hypothetical protein
MTVFWRPTGPSPAVFRGENHSKPEGVRWAEK